MFHSSYRMSHVDFVVNRVVTQVLINLNILIIAFMVKITDQAEHDRLQRRADVNW